MVSESHMKVVKGVLFVIGMVVVALTVFNGLVVAVSAYFGPFYEGDAQQNRNFGFWLVGNGVVMLATVLLGVGWYRRYLRRRGV
ncbi:hypothetical protein E4O98_26820 [Pseudomonas sp. W2Jun17]|uniref:DUF4381 domain-containing protein n=2 Tax=Pseudomonas TaxID=286 RepID=A0A5D3GJ09_9PSED|nr:hypothetical protein [Pseudomonas sp. W2Jun17]TYK59295.1 DUF4381 domain-containing protein [Pseudomonas synxantha]